MEPDTAVPSSSGKKKGAPPATPGKSPSKKKAKIPHQSTATDPEEIEADHEGFAKPLGPLKRAKGKAKATGAQAEGGVEDTGRGRQASVESSASRASSASSGSTVRLGAQDDVAARILSHIWPYKRSSVPLPGPFEATIRTLQETLYPKTTLQPDARLICRIGINIPGAAFSLVRLDKMDVLDFHYFLYRALKVKLGFQTVSELNKLHQTVRTRLAASSQPFTESQLVDIYTVQAAHISGLLDDDFKVPDGFYEAVADALDANPQASTPGLLLSTVLVMDAISLCQARLDDTLPGIRGRDQEAIDKSHAKSKAKLKKAAEVATAAAEAANAAAAAANAALQEEEEEEEHDRYEAMVGPSHSSRGRAVRNALDESEPEDTTAGSSAGRQ